MDNPPPQTGVLKPSKYAKPTDKAIRCETTIPFGNVTMQKHSGRYLNPQNKTNVTQILKTADTKEECVQSTKTVSTSELDADTDNYIFYHKDKYASGGKTRKPRNKLSKLRKKSRRRRKIRASKNSRKR